MTGTQRRGKPEPEPPQAELELRWRKKPLRCCLSLGPHGS